MNPETSFFAEQKHCGPYRLQTNDPRLVQVMNKRAKQPRSPWKITGKGLTQSDPMIFRRTFSSSTKAKQSFERILMRMDQRRYKLEPVAVGFGWIAQWYADLEKTPSGANKAQNRCHSSPKTEEAA